ncbi:MAG: hypothetical protein K2X77_04665 [Candidatus Obscuribacterales bacterium]|jgi:hypothetical protein|nr:hypothetical protein [Candidatus Obscuribacterales bacterium]
MSFDQNAIRSKQRLVILLVGVVGLAVAAILFLIYDSVKKPGQLATNPPVPVATQATVTPAESVPATDVTVVDASTLLPEQEAAPAAPPKTTKKSSRSSRRKQVAMRFPAPPVGEARNADWLNGPKSEVEMWAGDRRSVIWVPQGPKNHESHESHESHDTFY